MSSSFSRSTPCVTAVAYARSATMARPDRLLGESVRRRLRPIGESPLLSNIVLDELDRELARRGHRFVRHADATSAASVPGIV
jgi:hypothetical protein